VGTVKVDSNRKAVQHLEGGIVDEIKVRDGDRVKAGDILVVLDRTQAKATLTLYHGRKVTIAARAARLIAERDGLDEIPFSDWLDAGSGEETVRDAIRVQSDTLENRRDTLHGQVEILNQKIAQSYEEINGFERQLAAQARELAIVSKDEASVRKLLGSGFAKKPRLLQLERDKARLEGNIGQSESRIALIHQRIAEAKLKINGLKREFYEKTLKELQDAQVHLLEVTERERAARDILARTEIKTSISGTIVNTQVHSMGGVIAPGATLMEIVPEDDSLIVEAKVDPQDIDVVHVGLPAQVRFTAFSQRNILPAEGIVTYLSADSLVDERTGETHYTARVTVGESFRNRMNGTKLYPGMQAEIMILTGERTALEYLLKPIENSFRRAMTEN
jgi:membrane fusion protein, epimerase transport system